MGSDKKQELLGIKLKNGILIGKKANKTTPSPTWKLGFRHSPLQHPNFPMNSSVSARKIGANLWELEPQFNLNKHGDGGGARRRHHRRRRHPSHEQEGFELSDELDEEPPDNHQQAPEIETGLRRNTGELPSLRHVSVGKNGEDMQHVSSASCCSSMEVTPYVCAVTPTRYTLKTSTHLLKVLNRIWNLEEQHSSNMALIKVLKRELDNSRAQIKTLVEETKRGRQEMDELKKSTHERMKKAVRATRDELLDVKSSYMQEKKARILLESLCDEFAKGIRDYDQKVRSLQQNRENKDQIMSKNEPDRLILHVSEAWLDERTQMKCDFAEEKLISENLCFEIETFLQAKKKQSHDSGVEDNEILEKREEDRLCGVVAEPSSQLVSRITDHGPGATESSSRSMSRMAGQRPGAAEPSVEPISRMAGQGPGAAEPSAQSMSRMAAQGPGAAEPSSQLLPRMTDRGPGADLSSQSMSRMTDRGPGADLSSQSMSRTTNQGPEGAEPSSQSMSRSTDRGPGVAEPSSRRAREGVKNTLMAKLLEARLESQLSKSRTVRR